MVIIIDSRNWSLLWDDRQLVVGIKDGNEQKQTEIHAKEGQAKTSAQKAGRQSHDLESAFCKSLSC